MVAMIAATDDDPDACHDRPVPAPHWYSFSVGKRENHLIALPRRRRERACRSSVASAIFTPSSLCLRLVVGSLIASACWSCPQAFVPDEPPRPLLLGTIVVIPQACPWAVLYAFFERVKRVNLGTVFLSLDVVVFVLAIYLTGADKSWLFFLLFIRAADQANTNFRRALAFAHLSVGRDKRFSCAGAGPGVEYPTSRGRSEIFGCSCGMRRTSTFSLDLARTAERLRERTASAIRSLRATW